MKVNRYFLFAIILIFTSIPAFYYFFEQLQEDQIVDKYLADNHLDTLRQSRKSAYSIAQQVAKDFNVNQSTFKVLKMDHRPFLREDAGTLLTYKEGLCGEGTRVIVRLLNAQGYNATRITLYDKYMQYAHTLVSVDMDSVSFWIDSINSTDSLTAFLEAENVSAANFDHLVYNENIDVRQEKIETYRHANKSESFKRNLERYYIFSYEAIPYSKILSTVGLHMRVFNLQRPPRFISTLAEKPFTILFIFYTCMSIVSAIVLTRIAWWALSHHQPEKVLAQDKQTA